MIEQKGPGFCLRQPAGASLLPFACRPANQRSLQSDSQASPPSPSLSPSPSLCCSVQLCLFSYLCLCVLLQSPVLRSRSQTLSLAVYVEEVCARAAASSRPFRGNSVARWPGPERFLVVITGDIDEVQCALLYTEPSFVPVYQGYHLGRCDEMKQVPQCMLVRWLWVTPMSQGSLAYL